MYEITKNDKDLFEVFKENRRAYKDGEYDFTFEDRFIVYHCYNQQDIVYIALDMHTGLSSVVVRRNNMKKVDYSEYKSLIPQILQSIKYTGDTRYISPISPTPEDAIEQIFTMIMPKFGYRVREEQIRLSKAMYKAFVDKKIGLCEAEVGTGKTLAYLVAAIVARTQLPTYKSCKPITISTSSIELQRSIIEKDIPMISKMLMDNGYISRKLNAVLRKGKEHYMCLRRYQEFHDNIKKHPKKYKDLLAYFKKNKFAEKGFDLDRTSLPPSVKDKICVKGSCSRCPLAEECQYGCFKENCVRATNIDVQVTNHNLYLVSRKRNSEDILRNSCLVVIDEAHKLKDAALDIFGTRISSKELKGILTVVRNVVEENGWMHDWEFTLNQFALHVKNLMKSLEKYAREEDEEDDKKLLVQLTNREKALIEQVIKYLEEFNEISDEMPFEYRNWCDQLIEKLETFDDTYDLNVWVEKDENGVITLCSASKNIGDIIYDKVWSKDVSHVLTSGTMSDGVDFEFFKKENGISRVQGYNILEKSTPSPFRYEEHTRLYIPTDAPIPEDTEEYYRTMADKIVSLVKATNGHTAVLFTSYKALTEIYNIAIEKLSGYEVFKMTKGSGNIIEEFKKSSSGVIFASGAMWEGVDCAGDCLSSVIIARLPFPLRTATMEDKKNGCPCLRDFVNKYAVPEMIIKLRQGVGRLIRTENDTGVVSILDARASVGPYHKKVKDVLRKYPMVTTLSEVEKFMHNVKEAEYFANDSCQKEGK